MTRSLLGFTDHHCAETLLSTTVLMWFVLAVNAKAPRQRLWRSIAGGFTLGCYLLTWGGGSLFVLIVVVAMGLSLILRRLGLAAADDLLMIVAAAFAVAAVMVVPWITTRPYFGYGAAGLAGGVLLLFALRTWGEVTSPRRGGLVVYFAGLAASAGLCLALAYVGRGGWNGLATEIARLSPWRSGGYVIEAMPLLRSPARHPLPLWNDFVTCLFLAVLGAFWTWLRPRTCTSFGSVLLFVWTGVLVAATFGQVRFAYYLAVNVALLAGLACDQLQCSIQRDRQRVVRWATTVVLLLVVTVPAGARIRHIGARMHPVGRLVRRAAVAAVAHPRALREQRRVPPHRSRDSRGRPSHRVRGTGVVGLWLLDRACGSQDSQLQPQADTGEGGGGLSAGPEPCGGCRHPRCSAFALCDRGRGSTIRRAYRRRPARGVLPGHRHVRWPEADGYARTSTWQASSLWSARRHIAFQRTTGRWLCASTRSAGARSRRSRSWPSPGPIGSVGPGA